MIVNTPGFARTAARASASLFAALAALSPAALHATSYNVGTSGDWTTSTTWNPNIPGGPASTDTINAQLGSGAWSVNLGGDRTIASISAPGAAVGSTGQIDFVASAPGVNVLTVTGNLTKSFSAGTELRFLDGPSGTIQLNVGGTVTASLGTLVLSGNNTITGGTTLSGTGVLQLKSAGALGTSALALNGGTLDNISGAAMTLSGNNPINLGGNFAFTGTHNLNLGTGAVSITAGRTITLNGTASTLTFGGVLTNNANGNTVLTVNGAGNTVVLGGLATSQNTTNRFPVLGGTGNITLTGAVTDGGAPAGGFSVNGSGVVTLLAASTHNGTTAVTAGVLNIQHGDALGTTAGGTTVAIGGTLQLQGGITTAAEALGLRGTGASGQTGALVNVSGTNNYAGLIAFGETGGATISSDSGTLNLTNTGAITGGSVSSVRSLTLAGAGNGSVSSVLQLGSDMVGGVTKTGAGTWTLLAANTYKGATTISGGRLTIGSTGTINATSGVSIGSGEFNYNSATALTKSVSFTGTDGTLSGTGTIIPGVTITAGNVISPGNATGTGTLTLGALDAAGGATFNFSLGTASDLLAVTGAFTGSTAAGGLTFNLANAGGLSAGHAYTLLTFGSRSGLDYTDLATGSIASGFALDTSFGTGGFLLNSGNLQVRFAAVPIPEPSTVALLLGGATLLATMARHRRRAA